MWTARTIVKDLTGELRGPVLAAFWRYSESQARQVATAELANALHYRPQKLRKLPADKKAKLLATRINSPEFEQIFEMALMLYFTRDRAELLGAFLDQCGIEHSNGTIDDDVVDAPTLDRVRTAVGTLDGTYPKEEITLYLASAGLLMGSEWADATWPVVTERTGAS